MGRRARQDVDYFPHDCDASTRKTLIILESRFGNDGYTAWFKLLESLGRSDGLFIDCSDSRELKLLAAAAHVSTERYVDILDEAASLGAIDLDLWEKHRIIWSDHFIERLKPVFAKRKLAPPPKPFPAQKPRYPVRESRYPVQKSPDNGVSGAGIPQSKVKESKVKESKVKKSAATEVAATYIGLARSFLEKQREAFPKESAWKDFAKRVFEGADNLRLFVEHEPHYTVSELQSLLDWILTDTGDGKWPGWASQIRTLGGIRKRSDNGAYKLENAMASMASRKAGKSGRTGPG